MHNKATELNEEKKQPENPTPNGSFSAQHSSEVYIWVLSF